jgi:hypothetical protein
LRRFCVSTPIFFLHFANNIPTSLTPCFQTSHPLDTGLLDEDEGGDLWGAIRAEQEEFQSQLDFGPSTFNSGAFAAGGGGGIW